MGLWNSLRIYNCFLILLCIIKSILSNDLEICVKSDGCKCIFGNGTGFDLSTLGGNPIFYKAYKISEESTTIMISTYYFHPCTDTNLNITTTEVNECTKQLSLCRHEAKFTKSGNNTYDYSSDGYEVVGSVNDFTFSNDGNTIIYKLGPSNFNVNLACAETSDNVFTISDDTDPRNVVFTFLSREACLKQLVYISHRSFGTDLLIIFLVLVVCYLGIGILTKKFLMGAQGIEVIPNLTFWMDLPNLVREGYEFARNGFKVPARPAAAASTSPGSGGMPNSGGYDSI